MSKNKSYYDEYKRLVKFIEMVEAHTENWDELCTCGNHAVHEEDCTTMNLRKDTEYALYGTRSK